jgi:hypothetical protein
MAEQRWYIQESRQDRIGEMHNVIHVLVKPLGNLAFDLARSQVRLEALMCVEGVVSTVSRLDRFAEAARALADKASAAAFAARQQGVQLDLLAPRATEAIHDQLEAG